MSEEHPAPKLSTYEGALLQENMRLRGYLIHIANTLMPEWREMGHAPVSSWMVKEIVTLKHQIETLVDVAARK
jgi:hypothetical protein